MDDGAAIVGGVHVAGFEDERQHVTATARIMRNRKDQSSQRLPWDHQGLGCLREGLATLACLTLPLIAPGLIIGALAETIEGDRGSLSFLALLGLFLIRLPGVLS